MEKYIMLIIAIGMFIGFIIFKLYKIFKYSVKVEAKVIRHISKPDVGFIRIRYKPVYEYGFNGMLYHKNDLFHLGSIKNGTLKKIRINPKKPQEVYISSLASNIGYLFINFILFIIGIAILIGESII